MRLPLVKLPEDIDLLLFLIREELKNYKLHEDLRKVGFGECLYQSDFTRAILKYAGFDDLTDSLLGFYVSLLDRHTETLEPDSVMKHVFEVYVELAVKRKALG